MAGSITEEVEYLDSLMFNNFMAYAQEIMESWREVLEIGNNGQKALVMMHLLPAAYEHIGEAAYYWPRGAKASDYPEKLYAAYEPETVQRAFSNTINGVLGALEELQTEAEAWQVEHELLVAILGDSWEPHSVYPPFEGGAGWQTQPTGAGKESGVPQFVEL